MPPRIIHVLPTNTILIFTAFIIRNFVDGDLCTINLFILKVSRTQFCVRCFLNMNCFYSRPSTVNASKFNHRCSVPFRKLFDDAEKASLKVSLLQSVFLQKVGTRALQEVLAPLCKKLTFKEAINV